MKSALVSTLILGAILGGAALLNAQEPPPADPGTASAVVAAAPDPVQDKGWPRLFEADDYAITIYQPQLDSWPDFGRITFRAAIAVTRKGEKERTYGTIRVSAATQISLSDRLVLITDRKVEQATFADVPEADAKRLSAAMLAITPPDKAMTISLDRLLAQMELDDVKVRKTEVSLAPPKILVSDKPGVIVIFMGKPRFKPVPGSDLMFAINTNWDLFLDPATSKYYLLTDQAWQVTSSLDKGPWTVTTEVPAALTKLPADDNWADVRKALPPVRTKVAPVVFTATEPTELIVTDGAPELEPIPGTKLMLVANADNDLFYHSTEKQYYLLTAGRWFRAPALTGPWSAASTNLPVDFQQIPEDSDAADILASVPGTDAAKEAVLLASIPQKATINRADVTIKVVYDGPPQFKPIEKTTVQYAYNTSYNVFLVDGKYYCCHNAVWFVAPQPSGAWAVCDMVPAAIYTIPPTSPKYNVTYVTVYESTPTTVVTGYTAGYSGQTVAATGAVMFGLGLLVGAALADDHDDYYYYHWHSYGYSYGCGARYYGPSGGYVAAGAVYGPYGGAGHYAAYNPATGVYSRGAAAYGPNGAAGYRVAYNPSTGTAGYRAGGSNAYGSWGRAGVSNGDDWARAGYKSGPNGSVGAIQGSGGAAAIHGEGKYGNGATVARGQDGDIYAGKDGNVYKKTEDGWQQQSGPARPKTTTTGTAAPATGARPTTQPTTAPATTARPTTQPASTARPTTQPASTARPTTQPATERPAANPSTASRQPPAQAGNLQKEANARARGDSSASKFQQFKSGGGGAASRSSGSRSSGGRSSGGRGGRR